jgi:hypothetical protein
MKHGRCIAALICFFGTIAGAQNAAADYIVYVGSYTNTACVYPAQVWASPNGRFLYAANWQGTK